MNPIDESKDDKQISRHDKALRYCNELIDWYERNKTRQRYAYQISQILIVVLSGITPILVLVGDIPPLWQATPAAFVTILAGLSGIFQWKENYLRFAYTLEALKSEKIRFETRSSKEYNLKLKEATVLRRFVTRVNNIMMGETHQWRILMQQESDSDTNE